MQSSAHQTFSLYVKSEGQIVEFTSTLTDEQLQCKLSEMRSSFAQDLSAKFAKLSEKQYAWAHYLAWNEQQRNLKYAQQSYNFETLVNCIESAQSKGLKRISMRFDSFILRPGKNGRVYVLSHDKEYDHGYSCYRNVYLGWITESQTSVKDPTIIEALTIAAADPYNAARLYGQHTGSCSCCGRELTNSLSIELGIGPICREKFGL